MFNKSLGYNYDGKKHKKPPRVAYVPKHTIQVGYRSQYQEKEQQQIKPSVTTSSIAPVTYKSSISLPLNNLYKSEETKDTLESDNKVSPSLSFGHKPISNQFLSELLNINTSSNPNIHMMKAPKIDEIIESPNNEDFIRRITELTKTKKTKQELSIRLHELFLEKRVTKIINVYQEEYKDGKKATGFGDFLRGNYYLMQFCSAMNLQFDINMSNHPISKYFKHKKDQANSDIFKTIEPLRGNNFIPNIAETRVILYKPNELFSIEFMLHIITRPTYENGTIYIYVIAYPYSEILAEPHKNYMRLCLEPTIEIKGYVNYMMGLLRLREKQYITIHIRSGDRFLIHGLDISESYLMRLKVELTQLLEHGKSYLLLSDNTPLKHILIKEYPQLKTLFTEVKHSGEGSVLTDHSLKATLLDFYLLASSTSIYSFSCYSHGTGFSKWTAETYNIPYLCKFIEY